MSNRGISNCFLKGCRKKRGGVGGAPCGAVAVQTLCVHCSFLPGVPDDALGWFGAEYRKDFACGVGIEKIQEALAALIRTCINTSHGNALFSARCTYAVTTPLPWWH